MIIIPTDKVKQIDSRTVSTSKTITIPVTVEQPACTFTFFLSTLGSNGHALVEIYSVGDHDDDRLLLYTTPVFQTLGATPFQFDVHCPGLLEIDIIVGGSATYTLRGKAIVNADDSPEERQAVVDRQAAVIKWEHDILCALERQSYLLERILNHQRYITGLDTDDDEY